MRKSAVHARSSLRGRAAAAVAAVGLLAALPAAADAAAWIDGPEFDLGSTSSANDFAAAPDGAAFAAWSDAGFVGGPRATVRVQHATAAQLTGPVVDLGTAESNHEQVDVAVGAHGAAAVLWSGRVTETDDDRPRVTLLRPDGAVVATVAVADDITGADPVVAVDGDGDALLAWAGYDDGADMPVVRAQRLAADGQPGPLQTFPVDASDPQVAVTPGGVGWVLWDDGRRVARIGADGVLDGAVTEVEPTGGTSQLSLGAGDNGGAITRLVTVGDGARIDGVRLPLSGAVLGTPFTAPGIPHPDGPDTTSAKAAIEADGAITVAWTDGDLSNPVGTPWVSTARFAPEATTAVARRVPSSDVSGAIGDVLPLLAPRPGGGALLVSTAVRPSLNGTLTATTVGSDGLSGVPTGTGLRLPLMLLIGSPEPVKPFATTDGGALVALSVSLIDGAFASLTTRRYDAAPPQLSATIPATAEAGRPADFAASATDLLGGSELWWDFGDGNGARGGAVRHVYSAPGLYTVTVTAEDDARNVTTRTRQLTVPAPAPAPGPPVPPSARRSAANLKLTSALRSGGSVKIAGTIATTATGRVGLTYTQKNGRRTLTARTSATIAKGRFSVTLRLSRALAKTFRGSRPSPPPTRATRRPTPPPGSERSRSAERSEDLPEEAAERSAEAQVPTHTDRCSVRMDRTAGGTAWGT